MELYFFFFHFSVCVVPEGYRVLLLHFSRGITVLNSRFLHCYVNGKLHRVEDLREVLASTGVLKDLACSGILLDEPCVVGDDKDRRAKAQAASGRQTTSEGQALLRAPPHRRRGTPLTTFGAAQRAGRQPPSSPRRVQQGGRRYSPRLARRGVRGRGEDHEN